MILVYPKYFYSKSQESLLATFEIPMGDYEEIITRIRIIQIDLEKDVDEMSQELAKYKE